MLSSLENWALGRAELPVFGMSETYQIIRVRCQLMRRLNSPPELQCAVTAARLIKVSYSSDKKESGGCTQFYTILLLLPDRRRGNSGFYNNSARAAWRPLDA